MQGFPAFQQLVIPGAFWHKCCKILHILYQVAKVFFLFWIIHLVQERIMINNSISTCSIKLSKQKDNIPNAHTSDLLLNLVKLRTSGGAHFTGNFVPVELVYSSSITYLSTSKHSITLHLNYWYFHIQEYNWNKKVMPNCKQWWTIILNCICMNTGMNSKGSMVNSI